MSVSPDLGYDPSSLTWTYDSAGRLSRTTDFQEQHALLGDRFTALLNAAKRLTAHQAAHTKQHKVHALRRIAAAGAKYSSAQASTQEWLHAYAAYLRNDEDIGDTSRWGHFNHGSAVIAEMARYEGAVVRYRNPFRRRTVRIVPFADDADVERLIRTAKADAYDYVRRFRTPVLEHVSFIEEARRIWSTHGAILWDQSKDNRELAREWRKTTGLETSYLTSYLYPSAIDLAPFLILIGNALAGNPDSVSLMRRNALEPFLHPAYGECYKLQLEKARAGSIAPYLIRNTTTLSLGWLIDALLEISAPLVPFAEDRNRNFAFLAMTSPPLVKPLIGPLRAFCIRRYTVERDLPQVTLKALRTYRGISEYKKSGNIFRVQKLLNQSSVAMTIAYLDEHLTRDKNDAIIADAQASILAPADKNVSSPSDTDEPVFVNEGHRCSNPFDPSKPHDENGFCASYLWPFNDRCFILDFSPRPIAFVLRDYNALCEAQLRIPAARFERFYAARKAKIEADVLPYISPKLRSDGERLLPSLPPGPTID